MADMAYNLRNSGLKFTVPACMDCDCMSIFNGEN
jgi:hypothetical protein